MAEHLKSIIGICDGFNFVLPANISAEVVSGVSVTTASDQKPWQAGLLTWNGLEIPVISLEQIVIGRRPRLRGSHVVVTRGSTDPEALPFYGIPVQTMPNEYQLLSTMEIVQTPVPEDFNFVEMIARIRGVNCIIPNIEGLESLVISELTATA